MHQLRYRQVHLDFHTSPAIPGIGDRFDAAQFQSALTQGHVNSITCFAVCHHGWSYNETNVGAMHPNLSFDLLRAQFDAAKEIDVNVPVYITAGVNSRVAEEHPEWREVTADGSYGGWTQSPLRAGFKSLCFNTSYLDHVCALIEEVVEQFPNADGIFLDIIHQGECCCVDCLERMKRDGRDPRVAKDRQANARDVLEDYYRRTTASAQKTNPEMPVFHNSGHITRGRRDILKYFSHLEIESLPTGGWGYDHFPVSAKYCATTGLDMLGMTGKFHTTWGEFGGYKHPNALRYECAAMIAYGSKCSVGDQLHPSGEMDEATYGLIGAAYAEVEAKEPWCVGATQVADIALVSSESQSGEAGSHDRANAADVGASRVLLEEHLLFDVVDLSADLSGYRLIILPDDIAISAELEGKLQSAIASGAAVLLTGASGVRDARFVFDLGAEYHGQSEYQPDFALPAPHLRSERFTSPFVMQLPSHRIKVNSGVSLGNVYDPYFNRTFEHYCSHQHAPPRTEPSGYELGVRHADLAYLAHPIFSLYRAHGTVALREFAGAVIRDLVRPTLESNLPSTARVALTHQPDQRRYVLHLLYGAPSARGDAAELSPDGYVRSSQRLEVIEDLPELHDIEVTVRLPKEITTATLEPDGRTITLESHAEDGASVTTLRIDRFACHAMIALAY